MIGFRSRSKAGLPARIEALAEAVELAEDRLDEEQVAFARHVVDKAGARLRHGTTNTLVAVLGATGSGKSSVTNAVVGNYVATTGVRRPTTSSTLACFWGDDDNSSLLDWLEVQNRYQVVGGEDGRALAGLILLDVPDHDSVAELHREEMERIAEHADMLLWVTDHEKYADKAMHDYLRRLSGHGAVTAMVLNKADQLELDELEQCRADLKRLLVDDGLSEVPVVVMSALTGDGTETLRSLLVDTVRGRRAVVDRLSADTSMAADALLEDLGGDNAAGDVPNRVVKDLNRDLVEASGLTVVTDAVAAGYRRDGARLTGWPFTRWVRRLRPHPLGRLHLGPGSGGRASLPEPSGAQRARTRSAVRDAVTAVSADMAPPWPDLIADAGTPDSEVLEDRIDNAVSNAVRSNHGRQPRWWRAVNLLQIALALAVVAGVVWLALLAFAAYLRIPEPPTPEAWDIPIPTGLLIGGIVLGLVVSVIAARVGRVGAARRARAVRREATDAVAEVSQALIVDPVRQELDNRQELLDLLHVANGERGR